MKKLILLLLLVLTPSLVFAASNTDKCSGGKGVENRDCVKDAQEFKKEPPSVPSGKILPGDEAKKIRGHVVNKLMPRIINFILVGTISISVLFIIVGGIMYIFSMGESERINKAKEMILWALIGLAISVLAFTIVRIVTGIEFIQEASSPNPVIPINRTLIT